MLFKNKKGYFLEHVEFELSNNRTYFVSNGCIWFFVISMDSANKKNEKRLQGDIPVSLEEFACISSYWRIVCSTSHVSRSFRRENVGISIVFSSMACLNVFADR